MSDQAKPADWRKWLPADTPEPHVDTLLTRDQVLAVLRQRRVKATTDDLRYWAHAGVLPHPVRQWHEGATRALYPQWYPGLVQDLRRLQRAGWPLAAIGPQLRAQIGGAPPEPERTAYPLYDAVDLFEAFALAYGQASGLPVGRVLVVAETPLGELRVPVWIAPTASDTAPPARSSPPTASESPD